jgi:hypothetical protein
MGWIRSIIFVAMVAALGGVRAKAAEPAECRWTEEKITIDGVADETCWAKAQVRKGKKRIPRRSVAPCA